ncbi:DNA-3-methyladenine glycosylase family protein [Devosia sp. SL43]|uniref:DNA-3-methyladenine glycosylase family protein n=1 Tax=Devosia sp. SL43 TaxID=2806348 RepID=UPI001F1FF1D1|nr:DNA-3-methyladenine glycosylase [Devosia sp. SL43]UJW84015.1 DNA-3-methyladenine glycosylase 2 family protein [Devosia sp. SL43]
MNSAAPGLPNTSQLAPSPRLDTVGTIASHIEALVGIDPRLAAVRGFAGEVQPRVNPPGFVGIAKVICGQQLSVASARAIWSRFELLSGALDPVTYLSLSEEAVRATGFSGGKFRTVRAIAEAVVAGTLDFDHLETLSAEEAVAYLVAHKGIGPWTAEVYLMFCAQHPDVFPAGDLALLKAVQHGLGLDARPTIREMIAIAAGWAPHRSAAALLFWRYFAVMRDREGILL